MANKREPRSLLLEDPAAIEALASAHRLEIVSALGEAGEASIATLAKQLGRTPHSLYYHVKLLERAGVLALADTRRRGRRDEQIWKMTGERILLSAGAGLPASLAKTSKAVESMLRLTSRELSAAIRRHARTGGERTAPITGIRMKAHLDDRTLRRVVALMDQIGRIVADANRSQRSDRMFTITLVLAPTGDKTIT